MLNSDFTALSQHHLPGATFEAQPVNAGCMSGTRTRFLEDVLALVTASTGPHIAWVTGMAGTGKTSIALTLCRMIWADTTVFLGGSFFCSRSTGTIERTDVQRIVPTLATLLARQLPVYASALAKQLTEHPDAAHWSVHSQVERLLALPFEKLGQRDDQIVFVVDALDECSDQGMLVELIDALADLKSAMPVKLLLTSRPEMYIRRTPISDPNLSSILQLHTIHPAQVTADIHLYIDKTLSRASGLTAWYTRLDVEALVRQSCGLFIFVSTALKYILDRADDEGRKNRLRKVSSAIGQGTVLTAPLDQIYELVLTAASRPDRVDDDELTETKRVLVCILTARASLSVRALADLIEVGPGSLRGALERLSSLVHVPDDDTEPGIRTLHASFGDYMFERAPSRIRITAAFGHDIFASGCLRRMGQDDLCFNISRSSSSFESNPENSPDWIPLSLLYACLQWANHLDAASDASAFDEQVGRIFKQKFLFWLEVLSVMKNLGVASRLLRIAEFVVSLSFIVYAHTDLRQVEQQVVARLLREANYLVTSSYSAIAQSAPHIYLSALPFAAKDSLIHECFAPRCTGVVSVQTFGIEQHGGSLLTTLTGHKDIVALIVYSSNGRNLASSSYDRTVRIWDTRTGEETVPSIRVDHGYILAIAFVLSGTGIAICSSDGLVRIRNIYTGQDILHWLCDETKLIECASFSLDSALIASSSRDGIVRVRKTETGEQIFAVRGLISRVTELAFSSNGRLVAAELNPPTIHIWDSRTGLAVRNFTANDVIGSLAISPDGKVLAVARSSITSYGIEIWDLDSPARAYVLLENTNFRSRFAFSPDGSHLTVIGNNRILFYNCRTRQESATSLHTDTGEDHLLNISYSPDGLYIASASKSCVIQIWNAGGTRTAAEPLPEPSRISCVAVSRDNTIIVSGSSDGLVSVWDAQAGKLKLRPLLGHRGEVGSVAISSNGQLIASGSDPEYDGATLQSPKHHLIRLWDSLTGEAVDDLLEGFDGSVKKLAFSSDTSQLVSASVARTLGLSEDSTVHVWSLGRRTPSVFGKFKYGCMQPSIVFSPDERLLAAAVGAVGQVHIWQAHSGQLLGVPLSTSELPVRFLAFSLDGMRIITGTYDGTLRVRDISSGQLVSVHADDLNLPTYSIGWFACSPDGRFTARISSERIQTMRIWDQAAPGVVATVRVSPVGKRTTKFATARHFIISGG